MSQNSDVLYMLESAYRSRHDQQVCQIDMAQKYIMRGAARIHELRGMGYPIVTEECQHQHHFHGKQVRAYRLVPQEETLF